MRLVVVIFVLTLRYVYCVKVDDSETEATQNVDKRIKQDAPEKHTLFQKNNRKTIQSLRKDTTLERQRKRCDSCRDSIRCKIYGKCDSCTKVCKEYEAILTSATEAPAALVGNAPVYENDETIVTQSSIEPFASPNRYYTIGSFGNGPQQNLLVRLLNIVRKDSLDKLIVLAKPKGQGEIEGETHPVIIDTANVFTSNAGGKEFATEIHTVDGSKVPQAVDLELTSKIDRDLETAIKQKQDTSGKSYLTAKEMDSIIERALSLFHYEPLPSQSSLPLRQNDIQIGSRNNFEEVSSGATKRSISEWDFNNSNDNERFVKSTAEDNQQVPIPFPITNINQSPNKRTASGGTLRRLDSKTNYKGDSCLTDGDCTNSKEKRGDQVDVAEELVEYEPRPLSGKYSQTEGSKDMQTPDSIVPNLKLSQLQVAPGTSKVPTYTQLEPSADQHLAKEMQEYGIMQSPDKGKNSREADVLMLTHSSAEDNTEISRSSENNANFIAALKTLETKVEKIADLVRKTCGKENRNAEPDETQTSVESVGNENPLSKNIKPPATVADDYLSSLTKPIHQVDATNNKYAVPLADRNLDTVPTMNNQTPLQSPVLFSRSNIEDNTQTTENQNDAVVACEEESEEFVGQAKGNNTEKTGPVHEHKLNPIPENAEVTNKFQQSSILTTPSIDAKHEEDVGCSQEEFVGKSNNQTENTQNSEVKKGEVGNSKESKGHIGIKKPEITQENQEISTTSSLLREILDNGDKNESKSNGQSGQYTTDLLDDNKKVEYVSNKEQNDNYGQTTPKVLQKEIDNNEEVGCSEDGSEEFVGKEQSPATTQQEHNNKNINSALRKLNQPHLTSIPSSDDVLEHTPIKQGISKIPAKSKRPVQDSEVAEKFLSQNPAAANQRLQHVDYHAPLDDTIKTDNPSSLKTADLEEPSTLNDKYIQTPHTTNPFSIFGRVVPQLNDTDILSQKNQDSKLYFVGTGMQIPLNMKKHQDGSYQLSVDMDKLCNTCKGNSCSKIIKNVDKEDTDTYKFGEAVGPHQPLLKNNDNENQSSNQNLNVKHDVNKRRTKDLLVENLGFQDTLIKGKTLNRYNKQIAKEKQDKLFQQRNGKQINHHHIFDTSSDSHAKQSGVSKRSPNFGLLFPNLQSHNDHETKTSDDFTKDKFEEQDSLAMSSGNSIHNIDKSLNKIDKNMKRYYDRRYRLDNYYRNQNMKDLKHSDVGKDIVKRRVALVNNVLSWMQNLAVQKTQT